MIREDCGCFFFKFYGLHSEEISRIQLATVVVVERACNDFYGTTKFRGQPIGIPSATV